MRTYTITQEQMDRLHGAAHSGAMLGGEAAYKGCLKVGAILAEIAFKEGFDKSPGSAPEPVAATSASDWVEQEDAKQIGREALRKAGLPHS